MGHWIYRPLVGNFSKYIWRGAWQCPLNENRQLIISEPRVRNGSRVGKAGERKRRKWICRHRIRHWTMSDGTRFKFTFFCKRYERFRQICERQRAPRLQRRDLRLPVAAAALVHLVGFSTWQSQTFVLLNFHPCFIFFATICTTRECTLD